MSIARLLSNRSDWRNGRRQTDHRVYMPMSNERAREDTTHIRIGRLSAGVGTRPTPTGLLPSFLVFAIAYSRSNPVAQIQTAMDALVQSGSQT